MFKDFIMFILLYTESFIGAIRYTIFDKYTIVNIVLEVKRRKTKKKENTKVLKNYLERCRKNVHS